MSTEMRDGRPVRTYRGRSLEELIPKIRAELGPDAIILREREGLTGGFNGFFQQRCVEVDAQAAPASVDFYDDDDDARPDDAPHVSGAPVDDAGETTEWNAPAAHASGWPHEQAPIAAPAAPAPPTPPEPPAAAEPSPYLGAAQSYAQTPYAPEPAALEPAAPQPAAPEPDAPQPDAPQPDGREHEPEPEPALAQPEPDPVTEPSEPVAAEPVGAPEDLSFAQRLNYARQERELAQAAAAEQAAAAQHAAAQQAAAAQAQAHAHAAELARAEEPPAARGNLRVVDSPPAPAGATVTPIPSAPARDASAQGPGTRRPPAALRPFPSTGAGAGDQLDHVAAGAIARDLTTQGMSEAWAHELIVTAAAHLTPFTPGADLRAGVRAVIAGGILAPAPLPSSGAAVAFVGPGGSGKSRCAAALAAAYRRASTLQTRVVALGGGPRAADVAGLLAERDVPVDLIHGAAAADAIARGRERGLVVVDTDTTSPVDPQGVAALGDALAPLGLDAIYLTLPATMSATAARGLLDGLQALQPTALVITHADEANELGIVAELAYLSGLPIAFIHGGLDIDTALQATDPAAIAARVLP